MCSPAIPAPPNPKDTAAASTGTNIGTAIANANLGNVNQVTPEGALTYGQTGTQKYTDPYTGQTYDIPQYTATQTLSPEQEAIRRTNVETQGNIAGIGRDQSARIGELLGTPVDLSNDATEARLMELGMSRLQPNLDRRRASIETDLVNRGIRPGSDAYDRAQSNAMQGENDAFNELLLKGRGQSVQETLASRNQPINEITALLSGSQVSQPNFVNSSMPSIPTTDTAGIINDDYKKRLGVWGQKNAQSQNLLGGLFGLGSSLIMSDERVKDDITEIGETHDGQPLYSYRYKGSDRPQIGLMAQDVEKVKPEAVVTLPGGIKAVDYNVALGGVFGA